MPFHIIEISRDNSASRIAPKPSFKLTLLICLTLGASAFSYAQDRPFNRIDREIDLQKKLRQQEQIKQKLENNQREIRSPQTMPNEPADIVVSSHKFLIKTITIDAGDQAKFAVDASDLLKNYENRELGNSELFSLIREVTNRYAEKGYSTTTLSLIPKNLKDGTLELLVNWGKVEGWLINGNPPATLQDQLTTRLAMPDVVGKPL